MKHELRPSRIENGLPILGTCKHCGARGVAEAFGECRRGAPAVRLVVGELEGVACSHTMTEEDIAMLESIVARTLTGAELLRGAAVLEHVRLEVTKDWDQPEEPGGRTRELRELYEAFALTGTPEWRESGRALADFVTWVQRATSSYPEAAR